MSLKSISGLPLIFLARASTNEQGDSLLIQEELARKWGELNNTPIVFDRQRFYALESGAKPNRESVSLALTEIAQGRASGILVLAADRLSRSLEETCRIVRKLLKCGGILKGVNQTIDITTPEGIAFLQMAAVFAELERSTIKARVKRARESKVKEGGRISADPYGFDFNAETKKLEPNPYEQSVISWMLACNLGGDGARTITAILNKNQVPTKNKTSVWSRGTVDGILARHKHKTHVIS